ncbi:MAG: hypothetical protein HQL06_07390 [Nitrospirae bacterium]|nr:hypothetical protein [Nitrospirota bacterium]
MQKHNNIEDGNNGYVRKSDLIEIKEMIIELAHNQKEMLYEQRRFADELRILSYGQRRLEDEQRRFADEQRKTNQELQEVKQSQARMEKTLDLTVTKVDSLERKVGSLDVKYGGLSESLGYVLENEAYRALPAFLKRNYGLTITGKFKRRHFKGVEINFFGEGTREGTPVVIVGEAKQKLQLVDEKSKDPDRLRKHKAFKQLERSVMAVRSVHKGDEIVRLFITHFATEGFLKAASDMDIIVIQSFEW